MRLRGLLLRACLVATLCLGGPRAEERGGRRAPQLDLATASVELPAARLGLGALGGGRGADVCVVDTGVDVAHPFFRDAAGKSRVAWLLDLGTPPRGVHGALEATYGGAVWSAADLDDALAVGSGRPLDTHGHGTAIAGIAAGDGADGTLAGPLVGAAPEARLIIVKAVLEAGARDSDVIRAGEFCLELGAPGRTVVLVALGSHEGTHDGRGALEQALDALAMRAPVVVAAGNVVADSHAFAAPGTDGFARVTAEVPDPRGGSVTLDAVSDAPVERVDAAGVRSAPIAFEGAQRFVLETGGVFTLEARAALDVWVAEDGARTAFTHTRLGPADDSVVMVPGTARGVLTVGAVISRATQGTDALGDPGALAAFSPLGPTRDGLGKPDVVAPGGWIDTALSADLEPGRGPNLVGGSPALFEARRSRGGIAVRGTSHAAALVAGVIALGLAESPWRGEDDRRLLMFAARGERAWEPGSGRGTVDAARWLALRRRGAGGAISERRSRWDFTRNARVRGEDVGFVVRAADAEDLPVSGEVELRGTDGSVVRAPLRSGIALGTLQVEAPVRVEAWVGPVSLGALSVGVGGPAGAGGCAIGGRGAPPYAGAFALWLALLRARRVPRRTRG